MQNQEFTAKTIVDTYANLTQTSLLNIAAGVVGKLIWNGFKISIVDPSVKSLALGLAKYNGLTLVAGIVGTLFGYFLPYLTCREPSPALGVGMGVLFSLGSTSIQLYSLGSAVVLPVLGYTIIGAAVILTIKYLAMRCFFPQERLV